jgi:hypothetical protein
MWDARRALCGTTMIPKAVIGRWRSEFESVLQCRMQETLRIMGKMRLPSTPEQIAREMDNVWNQSMGGGERPLEFKRIDISRSPPQRRIVLNSPAHCST